VTRRVGVLISGRGSNLQAIIDATRAGRLDAQIALVVSNRADAYGLERARQAGVETLVRDHRAHPSRDAYEAVLVGDLQARGVELVCLAGFMRLLGATFVNAFPDRILNIHPALLPAFPGLHAQRQALEHGVKVSGATVHFVDTNLDAGPIVLQAAVPVLDGDTEDALSARILEQEHRIYPEAIQRILDGHWRIDGRRVVFSSSS
jgi:phosphoribosylglycinamide formyltransferase 1